MILPKLGRLPVSLATLLQQRLTLSGLAGSVLRYAAIGDIRAWCGLGQVDGFVPEARGDVRDVGICQGRSIDDNNPVGGSDGTFFNRDSRSSRLRPVTVKHLLGAYRLPSAS